MRNSKLRVAALLGVGLVACEDDPLLGISGRLVVEMLNLRAEVTSVEVKVEPGSQTSAPAARPSLEVRFDPVRVGLVRVEVTALDGSANPLDRASAYPVAIVEERESRVILDFTQGMPVPPVIEPPVTGTPGVCLGDDTNGDGTRDPLDIICASCNAADGSLSSIGDDPDCGTISCSSLDTHRLEGENSATGAPKCWFDEHPSIESDRCASAGVCKVASAGTCAAPTPRVVVEAAICELIEGCSGTTPPTKVRAPNGTLCGTDRTCVDGVCVENTPPMPAAGCADGAREGFLDMNRYPTIAGCSGAWSVGGVLETSAPACNRAGGDDGAASEGQGCASVDLCATGWHVCRGHEEVTAKAGSCADAVPPGAPDKSLFFALVQRSDDQTVCGGTGHNDVFGCGNLGTTLVPAKGCGPLTKALASTQANACGYNEAEPNLGPWQCLGGGDSHLRESELVTKAGCPNRSCSYDGQPVGSSDKGGVLCCRD
ncbi:MAG: hypothetical protein HY791_32390 [Deltaproteobacteria bacterium]|nr:hypothetical protein [Deltaproteobacteria bacterium]